MWIHEEETQCRFYAGVHIKAKSLYKRLVSLGPNVQDVIRTCSVARFGSSIVWTLVYFPWWYSNHVLHFAYPLVGTLISGYIPEHAVACRACSIFRGLVGCTTRAVFV